MIQIGLQPLDQAFVDNAIENISSLMGSLQPSEITFEEFIVSSLDPENLCSRIMDLNISTCLGEDVAPVWDIPFEKNIRYIIDSISMMIYDRLSNSNPGIRRLFSEVFLLEAFKHHPAQLAIISAPFHTPYSLLVGKQYSYWEPMEEDTFIIIDGSIIINELVNAEEVERLQPFVELFNDWDSIEQELVVKMLNKALQCDTLVELLKTIRDSICVKWLQNKRKLEGGYRSENLVFAITFSTLKNIL